MNLHRVFISIELDRLEVLRQIAPRRCPSMLHSNANDVRIRAPVSEPISGRELRYNTRYLHVMAESCRWIHLIPVITLFGHRPFLSLGFSAIVSRRSCSFQPLDDRIRYVESVEIGHPASSQEPSMERIRICIISLMLAATAFFPVISGCSGAGTPPAPQPVLDPVETSRPIDQSGRAGALRSRHGRSCQQSPH